MINLPNYFESKNIHLECESKQAIDFNNMVKMDVPKKIQMQICNTKYFYITISNMKSTVNLKESIKYKEIIVKIPVVYAGGRYLYPIVSFVDNIHSFLRGTLLGFYKEMEFHLDISGEIVCDTEYISFSLPLLNGSTPVAKPNELSSPFLLHRNISVPPNLCATDFITLDVVNPEEEYFNKYNSDGQAHLTIFEKSCRIKNMYVSSETFAIIGTKKIIEEGVD
ncbi:acetoacetate decarboxylase family protein [Listeria grandensis]|uniref:hypothetical protein n=1 Tax=Listeria grandensis TaxID=1494963 RepID=UPI00162944F5|nr:hypothetical protein [Listeria grandensis]MBC1474396.1 acetoacetate decarboxylase family protein [Listeria grandensis]